MVSAIENIPSASSVAPVITSGTGNTINNSKAFQRLRDIANARNYQFQQNLVASGATNVTFAESDLLNLDSQSIDVLNGVNGSVTVPQAGDKPASNANQPVAETPVSITPQQVQALAPNLGLDTLQRENLASIIRQFANAPFNQDTFVQIQNALVAARINPQQISLQGILQEVFSGAMPTTYYGARARDYRVIEEEIA